MKTQIVLPDDLMEGLRAAIPPRRRSLFIADAIRARLRLLQQKQALNEAAGAWSDAKHPDLKTQRDINRYLKRFRGRFASDG